MILESGGQSVTLSSDQFCAYNHLIKLLIIHWLLSLYALVACSTCMCLSTASAANKEEKTQFKAK